MAKQSKTDNFAPSKSVTDKLNTISNKMDNLYKDIYLSRPDNRQNLDMVIDKLDSALDRLQGDDISLSTMSSLLQRIDKKTGVSTNNLMTSVKDLFNDSSIIDSLSETNLIHRYIAGENYTYDLLCRYMPKLKLALQIVQDNTLCSDNFAKDFINPKIYKSEKDEARKFANNTKKLEKIYKFSKFLEKTYRNTSKYGEDFIYIVPYGTAFKRIIRRATNGRSQGVSSYGVWSNVGEQYGYSPVSDHVIAHNFNQTKDFKEYVNIIKESGEDMSALSSDLTSSSLWKDCDVNLYFNDSNVLQAPVHEVSILNEMTGLDKFRSLSSIREESILEKTDNSLMKQYEKVKNDGDKLSSASDVSFDGLIIPDNLNKDANKIDKNFNGAVVERIPRENILPVYMSDKCFGYYHFEFGKDPSACGYCGGHHTSMPGLSNSARMTRDSSEQQEELMIRYIASKISSAIDTHFINANKDLKEEIYAILHYNEQFDIHRSNNIGVTFIPADDIIHCYFEQDEYTHRGISDLKDSVVPGMLYILLYLTNIISNITRSNDKRIYYVKQNIETNVAKTMMNVIKQIKKGNMGMRQIESMNNILNIVGKYNDFIIPKSPSGEAPIEFEVLQGQESQTPTDLMDKMEEMAVNPIVPFEFVNSILQQDFAVRFTMTNSRFLKFINGRQRDTEAFASPMYTKIYNYEFDEMYSEIKIELPPPLYLVMQNNAQMFDNVEQNAQKIVDDYLISEPDDVKDEFKKLYIRDQLGAYINEDKIQNLVEAAKVNLQADQNSNANDGESAEEYM